MYPHRPFPRELPQPDFAQSVQAWPRTPPRGLTSFHHALVVAAQLVRDPQLFVAALLQLFPHVLAPEFLDLVAQVVNDFLVDDAEPFDPLAAAAARRRRRVRRRRLLLLLLLQRRERRPDCRLVDRLLLARGQRSEPARERRRLGPGRRLGLVAAADAAFAVVVPAEIPPRRHCSSHSGSRPRTRSRRRRVSVLDVLKLGFPLVRADAAPLVCVDAGRTTQRREEVLWQVLLEPRQLSDLVELDALVRIDGEHTREERAGLRGQERWERKDAAWRAKAPRQFGAGATSIRGEEDAHR